MPRTASHGRAGWGSRADVNNTADTGMVKWVGLWYKRWWDYGQRPVSQVQTAPPHTDVSCVTIRHDASTYMHGRTVTNRNATQRMKNASVWGRPNICYQMPVNAT